MTMQNGWFCIQCGKTTEHTRQKTCHGIVHACNVCGHTIKAVNSVELRIASRNQKGRNGENFRGVHKLYYQFRCTSLVYCASQTMAGYCRLRKAVCVFQSQRKQPGRPTLSESSPTNEVTVT